MKTQFLCHKIFVYREGDIVKQPMKKGSFVPKNVPGVGVGWGWGGWFMKGWGGVGHEGVGVGWGWVHHEGGGVGVGVQHEGGGVGHEGVGWGGVGAS